MTQIIKVSGQKARQIGDQLGMDWRQYKLSEFRRGLEVEQEHSLHIAGIVARSHLDEMSDYYSQLKKIEK